MDSSLIFVLSGACFLLYFLVLIVLYRLKRQARPLVSMGLGLIIGCAVILSLPLQASAPPGATITPGIVGLLAAIVFVGIVYSYFQFYGLIQYSISFKVLRQAHGGACTRKALAAAPALAGLLDVKLGESERMGLVVVHPATSQSGIQVSNTPAGSRYARLFLWIKRQMNWGLGG
jgi:hypothetical protein